MLAPIIRMCVLEPETLLIQADYCHGRTLAGKLFQLHQLVESHIMTSIMIESPSLLPGWSGRRPKGLSSRVQWGRVLQGGAECYRVGLAQAAPASHSCWRRRTQQWHGTASGRRPAWWGCVPLSWPPPSSSNNHPPALQPRCAPSPQPLPRHARTHARTIPPGQSKTDRCQIADALDMQIDGLGREWGRAG